MRPTALVLLALLATGACTTHPSRYGYGDRYDDASYGRFSHHGGGYAYEGDDWNSDWEDDLDHLDPWLEETEEGRAIVRRQLGGRGWGPSVRDLNISFRIAADANRDMRLTDGEIRLALVRWANSGGN